MALVISDVTGDDPTHIASGPCAPDPTTYQDALDILKRYEVKAPRAVTGHLARGARGELPETPKPGSRIFKRVENRVIATAQGSLQAAAGFFIGHDIHPAILGDSVTGEAREVAKVYGALAREVKQHGLPYQPPVALISGGETTVTVRGQGPRRPERGIPALAGGGPERRGGHPRARLRHRRHRRLGGQRRRAARARLAAARRRQESSTRRSCSTTTTATASSAALDDLVVTGPTRTNVNDYRVILIT